LQTRDSLRLPWAQGVAPESTKDSAPLAFDGLHGGDEWQSTATLGMSVV